MKKAQILKIFLLNFLLTFPHMQTYAAVSSAFKESLTLSENISIARLTKEKNDAYVDELKSGLYPEFKLLGNARYGSDTFQTREGIDRFDTNLALNLTHPLFQGGAEYPLYKLKILLPEKNDQGWRQEVKDYFASFVASYFQLAQALEEEEKQVLQIQNLGKRLQLLEKRVQIGQDKRSDLYLLRAQLLRLKADHAEIKSRLEQNQKSFSTLSALEKKNPEYFKDETDPLKLELQAEMKLAEQIDFKFSQSELEVANYQASIAKAAFFPSINLSANYYLDKFRNSRDDWDLGLTLSMNLFDFGETSSAVEQAKLTALIAEKNFRLKERELNNEWSELLSKFRLKKEQYQLLSQALDFSKKSYEDQLKDLSRGLINQIDLIRALDDIISLEKVVIKSAHDLKLFYYQAQAFKGDLAGVSP